MSKTEGKAAFPSKPNEFGQGSSALGDMFDYAIAHTERRISDYARRGADYSRYSKRIWRTALSLFIAGTLTPILGLLVLRVQGAYGLVSADGESATFWTEFPKLPIAEIGYVMLALSGGLVLYDQFFGNSRSWIRFRQSEAKLRVMLEQLRFTWASKLAAVDGDITRPGTVGELAELVSSHITAVEALAEAETKEWAEQFRAQIESFDQKLKTTQEQAAARMQGAQGARSDQRDSQPPPPAPSPAKPDVEVRVAVQKFAELDPDTLDVKVDGNSVKHNAGLIVTSLRSSADHHFVASARRNNKTVTGELKVRPSLDGAQQSFDLALN